MKNIRHLIHPYIFVLKEGSDIEHNRLDYTLMMLKVGPTEYFPSPSSLKVEIIPEEPVKQTAIST